HPRGRRRGRRARAPRGSGGAGRRDRSPARRHEAARATGRGRSCAGRRAILVARGRGPLRGDLRGGARGMTSGESGRGAALRDARDLRRGVGVNAIGYAFKVANPVLLALLTNAYGPERWGAFAVAQASILLAVRMGALGLDKGLLWWIPRQS